MFSSGPNYPKLKTNLRLAVNRLKLLEKKKTELALKARKEIADYIGDGKAERARIRVEHIIREDYLVEAYEIIEMFADLLLARFGLLQQMKDPDEGLKEAISSLIWIAPRIQADVAELKIIGDALIAKYGKAYGLACHENSVGTVSPKLMQKMSVQAPPKLLVEKYLIEIAKIYNVDYEPDPMIMEENDGMLIDMMGSGGANNLGNQASGGGPPGGASGGGGGGAGGGIASPPGFVGYPYMPVPAAPQQPQPMHPPAYQPFQYPSVPNGPADQKYPLDDMNMGVGGTSPPPKFPGHDHPGFNIPPMSNEFKELNVNYQDDSKPKPAPRGKVSPPGGPPDLSTLDLPDLPELPTVPSGSISGPNISTNGRARGPDENDIDFDDLAKRFEELKKRK